MNDRERFVACILGEPTDRAPYWLNWSPWDTTWARWGREGKPAHLADFAAVQTAFGSDRRPWPVPVVYGPCPRIERTVLEEDDESVVYTDTWGIKRRGFKHRESMSEFIEFPVKDGEDWERFRETYLDPGHPERLAGDWREQCAARIAEGYPILLGNYPDVGVFGAYRWLLGDEEGLVAFHTMPDLVHEIMDHLTTLYLAVFEQVAQEVQVDVIHIWEDMCYRNGPLISPRHWEEFLGPNYRRIKAFADGHGIPVISVDTDGDPRKIAAPMVSAGVNFLLPMEVAAGCDVNEWQARFPALAMMGGIDKRALAHGPEAIDAELARVRPAVERGRYIPCLDHLVPDDVSWDNYRYFAEGLREIAGKT